MAAKTPTIMTSSTSISAKKRATPRVDPAWLVVVPGGQDDHRHEDRRHQDQDERDAVHAERVVDPNGVIQL